VACHGIGVTLGLRVLLAGEGGLRHERAQPGIVGGIGQRRELLVGDGELLPQEAHALGDLEEAPLDQGPGHRGDSTPGALPRPVWGDGGARYGRPVDQAAWGIDAGYWDVSGHWRDVPDESVAAMRDAMGAPGLDAPPGGPPLWFLRAGQSEFLQSPADLLLEDGTQRFGIDTLPPDLPPGYHQLRPLDGGPVTQLVVSPGRCHLPPDLHTWGWAVQLHSARSQASWGIGDLADLGRLQRWAGDLGAGVLAVNPLHAPGPAVPQQSSPYYPSSRCFRSPLYLRVEEVPGATAVGDDIDRLASLGRALLADRHIDRDRVWALKREALEACFGVFAGDARFDDYLRTQGAELDHFATYCALADEHGNNWSTWPAELRHPSGAAVRGAADPSRVRFHAWLQWLLEEQLAATAAFPVIHDLAVGFDPGGADAWAWQDHLALDARIGAPPDDFNPDGQDWGLPPFVPWKLRAARYEPFIQTIRASFRHAGGLRIDHVMGLFRLFWLPPGGGAGGYVRYPAHELLDIVALESHRAGAFVVGEDLGTVEDSVRAELYERGVLSYRLRWFEPGPPADYPVQAVAAVTTHDLPTVAGVWTGDDEKAAELRDRVADATTAEGAVVETYRALGDAPSQVLLATLEDAFVVTERPNQPGTVHDSNWSLALPEPIETLDRSPTAAGIAEALRR
jgi:4-alpha-glucanotransferase